MNSYYFHKNTCSLTTVYHIVINCLTMFAYAKISKYTSKAFDITRYSDSIQFQSPTMLTVAGLFVILVSSLIKQWNSNFHCFLWNFTNSPIMTILTIISFYFTQHILCNWKSVVPLLDKEDERCSQHFKFHYFCTYIIKLITKDKSVKHDSERLSITFCSDETTEDVKVPRITFMTSIPFMCMVL